MVTRRREGERAAAYGFAYRPTPIDRFGHWLSFRRVRQVVGRFTGKAIGDFGCGYQASFVRTILSEVASATVVDLALAPDLKQASNVVAIEGTLPEALEQVPAQSLDVVVCNSILEHLWEPEIALGHVRRVLRQGGVAFINVPSWRGRLVLETAAFRLRLMPAEEMDDHKRYYSTNELWTLLVRSGFRPQEILTCRAHKLGLNTFAVCKPGSPQAR
jgi:2-polyprenyl-3-methyl-5-hydroxy-6-metoxy-1,4-benzoquinol methylase